MYTIPVSYGLGQLWVAISCVGYFSHRFQTMAAASVVLGGGGHWN